MVKTIAINPDTLDFGTVLPGTSQKKTATISATGDERVDVAGIVETDENAVFTNDFETGYVHPENALEPETTYFLDENGMLTADIEQAENFVVGTTDSEGNIVANLAQAVADGEGLLIMVNDSTFMSVDSFDTIGTTGE